MSGLVTLLLSTAGPIFFMTMQGSQANTANTIMKKQNTLNFSQIPFVSLFTNCKLYNSDIF